MFAQFSKKGDDFDPTDIDALGDAEVSAFELAAVACCAPLRSPGRLVSSDWQQFAC